MATVPLKYTFRSLWTRKLTSSLTILGLTLVVFVFAAVLMLGAGVQKTLVATGSDDNAIILRKMAQAELQSQVDRDAANIVKTLPEIAQNPDGTPVATTELYVLINLNKKGSGDMGNITVRGVTPVSLQIRPQVKMIEGRIFSKGTSEVIVGSNIAKRFVGAGIGQKLKFGGNYWTIVGIFDGNGTGFDSEVWGDVDQMLPAFGRPVYSSITLRLRDQSSFDALKTKIEGDRRTNYLEVRREKEYYADQSRTLTVFIEALGIVITVIFSFGAMIGAMITMYGAVANRTTEIGTLRALGFKRRNILLAFMVESFLISLLSAGIGLVASSFLQFFAISTVNFDTFSELSFNFSLTPSTIGWTVFFALLMGFVGGVAPAWKASRLNIVNALRG